MNEFLNYVKGVVVSPRKTFAKLVSQKETKQYILWIVGTQVFYGILAELLRLPIETRSMNPVSVSIVLVIQQVGHYSFVIIPVVFTFKIFVLHGFARLFGSRGLAQKLFIAVGLSGFPYEVLYLLFLVIGKVQNRYPPLILLSLAYPWMLYLTILAIASVYKISKKKASLILITDLILTIIVVFVLLLIVVTALVGSGVKAY